MNSDNVRFNSLQAWFLAARPKTLAGAAVPVFIGNSLAFSDAQGYYQGAFSWGAAAISLLFAFVMQIDANFVNDFFDYVKGTDDAELRLGPRRACAQGWVSLDAMKRAIAFTTCLACVIGLPLVLFGGLEMILIGLLCVVFCFLYTTHLSYNGWGDVLVLVFFGIVPVCVCYYLHLHTVTAEVMAASVACGLVIDGLLMVNNFRDRDTDAFSGKRTIVVKMGAEASLRLYLGLGVAAVAIGTIFLCNSHPFAFLLQFIYLVLHAFTYIKMKQIWMGRELNVCLGETARNIFVYGLCVSIGILL